MNLNRVAAIALCGLTLSACSSMPGWMSFDVLKPAPPTTTLQFESMPPGAEARVSTGAACRTPCAMPVAGEEVIVTFTLPGYQPQTVPVRMTDPSEAPDPNSPVASGPRMMPNPVYAELIPAPPPVTAKKKKKAAPRPKKAAPSAPKAAPAAANPAPAPAPAAAWPPPPAR